MNYRELRGTQRWWHEPHSPPVHPGIKAGERTQQMATYLRAHGQMPVGQFIDAFELSDRRRLDSALVALTHYCPVYHDKGVIGVLQ